MTDTVLFLKPPTLPFYDMLHALNMQHRNPYSIHNPFAHL
jgi:hypothetical protein